MPAPKRARTKILSVDRVPVRFQRCVLGYAGAREAFDNLTGDGFDETLLWLYLWRDALEQLEQPLRRGAKMAPWYALDGIPQHTLRRYPKRIHKMADEIERLDTKMQSNRAFRGTILALERFQFDRAVRGSPGLSFRQRAQLPKLSELPSLLHCYADYLSMVARVVAHYGPRAAQRALKSSKLIDAAKKYTGRPHYPQIATLLTAAYPAIQARVRGKTLKVEKVVEPRNLKPRSTRKK